MANDSAPTSRREARKRRARGVGLHDEAVPMHAQQESRIHPLAAVAAVLLGTATLAAASVYAAATPDRPVGDAVRGATVYRGCMGCHSLDENDLGPRHRGVVGRQAGTVPGYAYSQALKNAHVVWDPLSLDRWLTNPQDLVPGAKMYFSLSSAQDRADVIAFLSEQR